MKILFCTNSYDNITNGPAKFARNLSEVFNKSIDGELYILSEDIKNPNCFQFNLSLKLPKLFRHLLQFYRMFKYMERANLLDLEYQFDLIIYNHALTGSIHSIFSKKVIGMVNDENNIINAFTDSSFIKLPTKVYIFQLFERVATRNMSHIIVNSFYLKSMLEKKYSISNVSVLHKGIEDDLVNSYNFDIITSKKESSITFIKTDFKRGGLDILIKALKYVQYDFTLTVVGVPISDQEKYKSNNYDITWIEKLDQKDIFALLRSSELFCLPAHSEAFGVANLEAIASGCKIISTNVGGIPEALSGFQNVNLINAGDYISLGKAINKSLKNNYNKDDDIANKLNRISYSYVNTKFKRLIDSILEDKKV